MTPAPVPDPFRTLEHALWIGGGQWSGKTTVAGILAQRHALTAYHYDFHDARTHEDRRVAARARTGQPLQGRNLDDEWVHTTPAEMVERTLTGFPQRFAWALEDLAALESPRPVLAEGWGLRPELVAGIVDDLARMVVMVPTDGFRAHQQQHLARADQLGQLVSDPARAQRNRLERDRLVAHDATERARTLGIRVLEIDGAHDAERIADTVEEQFQRFLDPHMLQGRSSLGPS